MRENKTEYQRIQGEQGFGIRNEDEERVLDFAEVFDKAVINAFFKRWNDYVQRVVKKKKQAFNVRFRSKDDVDFAHFKTLNCLAKQAVAKQGLLTATDFMRKRHSSRIEQGLPPCKRATPSYARY
uniref:Transposase n=1 Tax=Ascaris lumbricoides TaxID=6252 RepID=A0A0M3HZG2_ASCLU